MKFGIELETISTLSRESLVDHFRAAGLSAETASHGARNYQSWQMESDGSIIPSRPSRQRRSLVTQEDRDEQRPNMNYRYGVEIVSPVLDWSDAGRRQLELAIDTAAPHVTVNTSCGFHVHVSADGLNGPKLARLKRLWLNLEPIVFSYLPPSRRNNHYCQRGIGETGRYYGLNLTCLPVKGTVEFRCHHGTMNKKKIISWVAFCIALVEFAKGDEAIPEITLSRNATGADVIEVTFRNRRFTVTPRENGFEWDGSVYRDLKTAVFQIVKSLNPDRTRPIADRFINRNVKRASMENGGMAAACAALRVDHEAQLFLVERYDLAVRTWGLAN
jgi:hypothetical protein